nr:La protein 1 [Hymenolepis microstoma]
MDHKKSITQSKSKRNKKHPNNTVPTPGCANEEQISQLEKAVEIKSPIQHVDSSGRSANQNQSSRKKRKRVWTEISYTRQPKSNSNYVASCTADAGGLTSVVYARRRRNVRNYQPNRWSKRQSWNKVPKESAKPETEVNEKGIQIRERSLNVDRLNTVAVLDQSSELNQPHQDFNSNEISQLKAEESVEAQVPHVPNQVMMDNLTDALPQELPNEHFNMDTWSNLNFAFGPSIAPIEYLPMIPIQQNEIQIFNHNPPSFIPNGAISSEQNPGCGPQTVELDELVEKIKENPDKVWAHKSFKENETVRNAIAPYVFPPSTADEENNSPCDRIVYIGDELYLRKVNTNYKSYLGFTNRTAFIIHHVKHYFSEENLLQDVHLKNLLRANQGVCPFEDLLEFFRLKMVNTDVGDLVECANSIENVELVVDSYFIPIGYRLIIPLPELNVNDNVGVEIPVNPSFSTSIAPSQFPTIESSLANVAYIPSQVPQNVSYFPPVMTSVLPPLYPSTPQYPPYFNSAFYMPYGFPYS